MTRVLRASTKAIPAELIGKTPDALIGRNIFDGSFLSPIVVARAAAIEHNLATMMEFCRINGAEIAPHGKTTMSPELIRRQIAHGAWGVTVANAVQARMVFDHGVRRVILANQLVNKSAVVWAFDASLRGLDLYCFVDSTEGLALLAGDRPQHPGQVSVLLEIGLADGRSGVRAMDEALALAEQAASPGSVRLAGVAGYEGVFVSADDPCDRSGTQHYLEVLATAFDRIAELGLFNQDAVPVLTAGGSACFDDVVNILKPVTEKHGAELVLRSGCYITHDNGLYDKISPLRNHPDLPPLQPALEAVAQVTSRPEPTLVLLDLGKRDVSFDEGLPVPLWRHDGPHRRSVPTTWRTTKLMDQHLFLAIEAHDEVAVGDFIAFGISHPCTTFDKWEFIPEIDDDGTIVAVLTTEF